MAREPVPEAIVSTLMAAALVYPASPKMALMALFVGVPTLVFMLPYSTGDPSRRALRGEGDGRGSRLVTVAGLTAIVLLLLLVAYLNASTALPAYLTFVGSAFLARDLYRRFHSVYSGAMAEGAARAVTTVMTGLLLTLYYLGIGVVLSLVGFFTEAPEGGA